jgi:PKD repeat protein
MMCPIVPPDATVGEYYSQQITFYLPANVNDPGSGIAATLVEVDVTSISGLPYGMELTFNNDDDTFLPAAGENFGCATLCGTPVIPGTFTIFINANVLLEVLGFETSQPQSFSTSITVIPGSGNANSFAFDNNAGCGEAYVNYSALVQAPPPDSTGYYWDFGNGNTAEGAVPQTAAYTQPGSYTAALTTTIYTLNLQTVQLNGVNGNWSGDFDDLISEADPYFVLSDADGVIYTSPTIDNNPNASWQLDGLSVNNPPYTLQFFDDDDISQDDDLGAVAITPFAGTPSFDAGNGTSGGLWFNWNATSSINDSITVSVFALPDTQLILNGDVATIGELNPQTVFWLQNDMPANLSGSSVTLLESGVYFAEITNDFGCAATTNSIVYCAPLAITYDELSGELYVDDTFDSYQWIFNGIPLDGANSAYLIMNEPGNYAVEVTTEYGCDITSEVLTIVNGIKEITAHGFEIYPNPVVQNASFSGLSNHALTIHDATGREIYSCTKPSASMALGLSFLESGIYFARQGNHTIRFIKL